MNEHLSAKTTREVIGYLISRIRHFIPVIIAALPVYALHHVAGPVVALLFLLAGVALYVWYKSKNFTPSS